MLLTAVCYMVFNSLLRFSLPSVQEILQENSHDRSVPDSLADWYGHVKSICYSTVCNSLPEHCACTVR